MLVMGHTPLSLFMRICMRVECGGWHTPSVDHGHPTVGESKDQSWFSGGIKEPLHL